MVCPSCPVVQQVHEDWRPIGTGLVQALVLADLLVGQLQSDPCVHLLAPQGRPHYVVLKAKDLGSCEGRSLREQNGSAAKARRDPHRTPDILGPPFGCHWWAIDRWDIHVAAGDWSKAVRAASHGDEDERHAKALILGHDVQCLKESRGICLISVYTL